MKRELTIFGNPVLRQTSEEIVDFDDSIRELVADMLETIYANNGLGLAAEQIGRTEAVCIIHVPAECDVAEEGGPRENPDVGMPLVLINPEITDTVGKQTGQEGCLSFPGIFVQVSRPQEVEVAYSRMDGERVTVRVRGLVARAVLHEVDHLNAVLLIDRMSPIKKISMAGQLKRLRKQGEEQG